MDSRILKAALEQFGDTSQKLKTIEECSELIKELCDSLYGRADNDKLIEELVDVQLMVNQLRHTIGDEHNWDKWHDYKLQRLKDLIKYTGEQAGPGMDMVDFCDKYCPMPQRWIEFPRVDNQITIDCDKEHSECPFKDVDFSRVIENPEGLEHMEDVRREKSNDKQ